jgi:protease-4
MKNLFKGLNWKCFFMSILALGALFTLYAIIFGFGSDDQQTQHISENQTTTFTTSGSTEYTYQTVEGDPESPNKVLLVQVNGLILTEQISDVGFFDLLGETGFTYGYDIKDTLYRAAENPDIKAVMVSINSPGGTIGGSKAIGEGISHYKKQTGNPVYAHIVDQGTSGGYWAAAATDNITAEVGSLLGSIGVIMGPFRTFNNVLSEGTFTGSVQTENGIDYRFFTGGEYKDTGSPYREFSEEEIEHWQDSIDDEYETFVAYVSQARDLSPDTVRNEIKALPYGTKEAQALGLIDTIGGRTDSFNRLLATAGIPESDYELLSEQQDLGFFDMIFQSVQHISKPQVSPPCPVCNRPVYLYDGGFQVLQPTQ